MLKTVIDGMRLIHLTHQRDKNLYPAGWPFYKTQKLYCWCILFIIGRWCMWSYNAVCWKMWQLPKPVLLTKLKWPAIRRPSVFFIFSKLYILADDYFHMLVVLTKLMLSYWCSTYPRICNKMRYLCRIHKWNSWRALNFRESITYIRLEIVNVLTDAIQLVRRKT